MSHQTFFLKQFKENFFYIGSALPSSHFTGQAMVYYLAQRQNLTQKQGPVNVLEVGAGTGAFTNEIVPLLDEGDHLDVVEINPYLLGYLKHQLAQKPVYQNCGASINFINSDVRHIAFNKQYDYIVYALPMVNFPPTLTQEILKLMFDLLKSGGTFSYITYIFISRIKYMLSQADSKATVRQNQQTIAQYAQQYQIGQKAVFLNAPPAWVIYWRK